MPAEGTENSFSDIETYLMDKIDSSPSNDEPALNDRLLKDWFEEVTSDTITPHNFDL